MLQDFLILNLAPLLIAILTSLSCALIGNFLMLRRQAMIGDAISHVVLPGIVVAFLLTGAIEAFPMAAGATGAAVLAVLAIEMIRRVGGLETGAAMGVVFTTFFAAGILVLEQSDTSRVHLDVEHALYGNLESLVWLPATGWGSLADPAALSDLPPQLLRLFFIFIGLFLFVAAFWKELAIAAFDPDYALNIGAKPRFISALLVLLTAVVAVMVFDAVGAIIVIAMFVCPPATARLMTERLFGQVLWSLVIAAATAMLGYWLAAFGPAALGLDWSLSAAGMIAVTSGLALAIASLIASRRKAGAGG